MKLSDVNNFFGDMDLILMDYILKGLIPESGKVLDIGCGEGRNGIYFISHGYEYHGWDKEASSIRLIEYLAKSIKNSHTHFLAADFFTHKSNEQFDFLICLLRDQHS